MTTELVNAGNPSAAIIYGLPESRGKRGEVPPNWGAIAIDMVVLPWPPAGVAPGTAHPGFMGSRRPGGEIEGRRREPAALRARRLAVVPRSLRRRKSGCGA